MESIEESSFSLRNHPFTQLFSQTAVSVVNACSREEFLGSFAGLDPGVQEYLHKIYTIVMPQIQRNIIAEFGSICKEHQVLEVLNYAVRRNSLYADEVGNEVHPLKVLREVAIAKKQRETEEMRRRIQEVNDLNQTLAAKLESARAEAQNAKNEVSVPCLAEEVRNLNLKMMS